MLEPKVAVITGASAGLGKATARTLLGMGWRVIGVGRDPTRCDATQGELAKAGDFTLLRGDLSLLRETRRIAQEIAALTPRIDALLANAGGVRDQMVISDEGHEATFAANHLAHFLLVRELMPRLAGGRVVSVSSNAHEYASGMNWDDFNFATNFSTGAAYCQAKLANILFTRELARRASAEGTIAHAMHPGIVDSNFASHGDEGFQARMAQTKPMALTPEAAAETLVWLATAQEPARSNGGYWHLMKAIEPSAAAQDDAAAARLWAESERLIAAILPA
jgi:NAD(P)-dependent dehydrogenase (short-subunit alcohol dehydrogenase family)